MKKLFAVFDVKAAAFGTPIFLETRGLALRSFSDVCSNPDSPMAKHPADYQLYELGEYDQNSGLVKALDKPLFFVSAADVVQQLIAARTGASGVLEEVKA